ncbi:MAG: pyridoxal kinase PdxY [Alphaproteobacteria bacterium]
MPVLSIQSHVAYGYVGNAAAVFPMQRLGIEVWPVHTVLYSNHKGYGDWDGVDMSIEAVASVLRGIEARGVLSKCEAVLTGFIGVPELTALIVETVAKVRAANPKAFYCCDPVMGDEVPGLYVSSELPDLIRTRLIPIADIVTPNQFELNQLTGMNPTTLEEALKAADTLLDMGPRMVLLTSLKRAETEPNSVEMLLVTRSDAWLVATPLFDFAEPPNGSGDMTASLFTAHFLKTGDPATALAATTASIFAVFEATHRANSREITMIEAQDALVHPSRAFAVEKVR